MNTGRQRPPVEQSYGQQPGNEPPHRYNQPPSHPPTLTPGQHPSYESIGSQGGHGQTPSYGQQPGAVNSSGYPPRQSTAQSIRTAAAGIHGAGETLRGALNTKVASLTGGTQEEIAAHNAVTERGRREIETGRFYKPGESHLESVPEVHTPPLEHPDVPGEKPKKSRLKNVLRKKSRSRERGI